MTTRTLLSPILAMIIVFALNISAAHAQNYTKHILYSFTAKNININGNNSDGEFPAASLLNVNGILYGTTPSGGSSGGGTLFSVNATSGAEKTLCTFTGSNGADSVASLIQIGSLLYGTTSTGGNNGHGEGVVFSLDPASGTQKTLCTFTGDGFNKDASQPNAGLVNVNGTLFGTTLLGGTIGQGTVFSLSTDGSNEKIDHSFAGDSSDGASPFDGLLNVSGTLYGTTRFGGAGTQKTGFGTVFALNTSTNAEQIVYVFQDNGTDGEYPTAGLINVNGILYGTTTQGGSSNEGTVFSINPSTHAEKILYSFTGSNGDGDDPQSELIDVNGTLYGTTFQGGTNNKGTVFAINSDGTGYRIITSFGSSATDGSAPQSGLIDVKINGIDTLYGTTSGGGANGTGTVFSLNPLVSLPVARNDSCTIKYNTARTNAAPGVLGNDTNGGTPITAVLVTKPSHGSLTLGSDGSFTYTPSIGYAGTDTFTYQAVNAVGKSNTATCTLTVVPVAPIARSDAASIKYETARVFASPGVLANDDNGGSSPITAALVTNVTHGKLTLGSDGSFTYTPNTGYAGTDTFTYKDTNSVGTGNTATVTLTVIATTPTAKNDACTIAHNKARTNAAPGVLANDDNGGTNPMTATLVKTTIHGTLTLNSNGAFTYTPNTGYSGTDTFTYQAINSVGKSNVATCTLTVQ